MVNEIPWLRWYQFHVDEFSDPSGERHIPGGAFAYDKTVGSGTCVSGISFPEITIKVGSNKDNYASTPIALVFHLSNIDSGSGVGGLRFYLDQGSALDGDGMPPKAFIQMIVSGQWQPFLTMPSGYGTPLVPGVVPELSNVFRQNGGNTLENITDDWVSQYVYLNVVIPNHFPLGTYGICGSGSLRFAVLYDYFNLS
jgi:hypothetical protein